jgi:hypothetical protein
MTTIVVYPWKVTYDYKATYSLYSDVEGGEADRCDCAYCQKFRNLREEAYPRNVRSIFDRMGIDYQKESDVYQINEVEDRKHLYGGSFVFFGSVECLDPAYERSGPIHGLYKDVKVTPDFSWAFMNVEGPPYYGVPADRLCAEIVFRVKLILDI